MFKNWGDQNEKSGLDSTEIKNNGEEVSPAQTVTSMNKNRETNTILKGSRLIGDINISCNMELSGEIEGNITSINDSNIVIKGTCKGNIETKEGNVEIIGELQVGNITSGNNVIIAGKFNGGEIAAAGKIQLNGQFNGKIEGNEIEVGPNANGKGELHYREIISIAKGANIECQIRKAPNELKLIKTDGEKDVKTVPPVKEISKAN